MGAAHCPPDSLTFHTSLYGSPGTLLAHMAPGTDVTRLEPSVCRGPVPSPKYVHLRVLSMPHTLHSPYVLPLDWNCLCCSLSLFTTLTFETPWNMEMSNLTSALGLRNGFCCLWFLFPAVYIFLVFVLAMGTASHFPSGFWLWCHTD